MTTKEQAQTALDMWNQVVWTGTSMSVQASLDTQFYVEMHKAICAALKSHLTATDDAEVREAVEWAENLRCIGISDDPRLLTLIRAVKQLDIAYDIDHNGFPILWSQRYSDLLKEYKMLEGQKDIIEKVV